MAGHGLVSWEMVSYKMGLASDVVAVWGYGLGHMRLWVRECGVFCGAILTLGELEHLSAVKAEL